MLGPLFFLVYINDLSDDLNCDVKRFLAVVTSLFTLYSLFAIVHVSHHFVTAVTIRMVF